MTITFHITSLWKNLLFFLIALIKKVFFQAHINKSERKRLAELGKVFVNPYDFGAWHNWNLFLGNNKPKATILVSLERLNVATFLNQRREFIK